jgi:outer membrane protein OmpA-like peptidoglycan-associated protein
MTARGLALAWLWLATTSPAYCDEQVMPAAEIARRLQLGTSDTTSSTPEIPLPADEIVAKLEVMRAGEMPATIILPGIAFAAGSAQLTPMAERQLDEVAAALERPALANVPVTITSHTDSSGNAGYNQRLSQQRAVSVRQYLIAQHDLSPDRVAAIGMGEQRPLPGIPAGAAPQRRVELTVAY